MRPDFVYIRCPHCSHVFRTSAGIDHERLVMLLPVLKLIRAKCPGCGEMTAIGNAEISWSARHAA